MKQKNKKKRKNQEKKRKRKKKRKKEKREKITKKERTKENETRKKKRNEENETRKKSKKKRREKGEKKLFLFYWILIFGDTTRWFVGHDYPSDNTSFTWETSVGEQKERNLHLKKETPEAGKSKFFRLCFHF